MHITRELFVCLKENLTRDELMLKYKQFYNMLMVTLLKNLDNLVGTTKYKE